MNKKNMTHVYYVAPGGNDRWSGHAVERHGKGTEGPWATLEGARDRIRRLRKQGMITGAVQVRILPGVYRLGQPLVFGPEDGGTAAAPVTWSGFNGRPVISGARKITGWTQGVINGVPCWQVTLPEVAAGRWWFTQLFVNGRRRLRARLPKQGFSRFAGVPEDEAKRDTDKWFHAAMAAILAPGDSRDFRNPEDIDVVVLDHWWDNHLRIASIDQKTSTIRFSTKGYSRFSKDETNRPCRYYLDHVAEACTDQGDWYLDRATGVLSYIPVEKEDMATARVEAPALDLLLSVRGDMANPARRVRHLRFEFLDFRHMDWELPRENPSALQAQISIPAAVRFVGAEDCALYACQVSQVAGWGVEVLRGCRRNRIVACALFDLGAGGVKVGHEGGLPRYWVGQGFSGMDLDTYGWGPCQDEPGGRLPGRDRAEPSATTVGDCTIHDGGIIFRSATGILVGDASGNRILHNHIWNFDYSGISCGWTWSFVPAHACDNRIDGNRIHDIGRGLLSDMGGIYTLGRQAGGTIRRNVISRVYGHGYGAHGIYCDQSTAWLRIEENVVSNTKTSCLNTSGNRDVIVRRNLLANAGETCVRALKEESALNREMQFEHNLVVQGNRGERLWDGEGVMSAHADRNVYVLASDARPRFSEGNWDNWRKAGQDACSRMTTGASSDLNDETAMAFVDPALYRAAGMSPAAVAEVLAKAGPRFRGTLPASIDKVRPEELGGAAVERILLNQPAEWPDATSLHRAWSHGIGKTAPITVGQADPISLTVENRGTTHVRGAYRLRVAPAGSARWHGPRELKVNLAPGERAELSTALAATGRHRRFRVEAVSGHEALGDTLIHCTAIPAFELPRLGGEAAGNGWEQALAAMPARPVNGNDGPFRAVCRLALTGERLLVAVETDDATPCRGRELWNGSSCELFVAPEPGKPPVQLVAVPALDGLPPLVSLNGRDLAADGAAQVSSGTRPGGWRLAMSLPVAELGLPAGVERFVFDMVVTAHVPGEPERKVRHLSCQVHPYPDSDCYARIRLHS